MKDWTNLPGVGPWKVLDNCPAPRHCTLTSARGKPGDPTSRCICPRALALREKDLARSRDRDRRQRIADGRPADPIGRGFAQIPRWFKQGPWKISPLCIARGHNNLTWARGGGVGKDKACTCPRALALLAEWKASRNQIERGQRKRVSTEKETTRQKYKPIIHVEVPAPDWTNAACRNPDVVSIVDMGFNEEMSKDGIASRQAAKDLCSDCPLSMFRECKAWIIAKEKASPGQFGGVYAGMDKWNRQGFDVRFTNGRIEKVKL